jgi:hypothetical protein
MTRPLLFICLALASGCTFNVRTFSREVAIPDDDPAAVERVRVDDLRYPNAAAGAQVVVRGSDRADLTGTLVLSGLIGAGESPDAVAAGVTWDWPSGGDPVRELLLGYRGPAPDSVRFETLTLDLPTHVGLDLSGENRLGDIDVAGLDAPVFVATSTGDITVRDATEVFVESSFGAIDVVAGFGTIDAPNGGVTLDFAGSARVLGGQGDVRGRFGAGGEITTRAGDITVVLEGPLTQDLTVGSTDGAIDVTLPDDVAAELHVESRAASESIRLGDVTADQAFEGVVNGGGPHRITILSDRGNVSVHRPGA